MPEQKKWAEHAAFMNALANDGFVVLGGPLGDGARILLIVDADSEGAIQTRLAADPWAPIGLLRIAKVERWEILLGGVNWMSIGVVPGLDRRSVELSSSAHEPRLGPRRDRIIRHP